MPQRAARSPADRTEVFRLMRTSNALLALLLDAEREFEKSVWELPGIRRSLADVSRLRNSLEALKREGRNKLELGRQGNATGVLAIQDAFHAAMKDFVQQDEGEAGKVCDTNSQLEIVFPAGLFCLSEVLQLFGTSGKTGVLRVESTSETIQLHIYQGCLTHALSVGGPEEDRLGAILVRRGVITREDLAALLETSRTTKRRLGRLLRDEKTIDPMAVIDAIHEQLTRLFRRAFESRNCRMSFRQERVAEPEHPGLDITGLILRQVAAHEGPRPLAKD